LVISLLELQKIYFLEIKYFIIVSRKNGLIINQKNLIKLQVLKLIPILSGLEMIKGIAVKVLNFICGKRQLVIEFIDGFVLLRRFTKYRLMVENLSQEESFPLALDKKG